MEDGRGGEEQTVGTVEHAAVAGDQGTCVLHADVARLIDDTLRSPNWPEMLMSRPRTRR